MLLLLQLMLRSAQTLRLHTHTHIHIHTHTHTHTHVQNLCEEVVEACGAQDVLVVAHSTGSQFTRFTGTKVQVLTQLDFYNSTNTDAGRVLIIVLLLFYHCLLLSILCSLSISLLFSRFANFGKNVA